MNAAIIIPAFNAAPYIAEAIDSALKQTRSAARVVVVDDGSIDETSSIAEQFGEKVTVLRQANAGVCTARNLGARATDSEWLVFLDADDRLRPEALEVLGTRVAESALGAIYGKSILFSAESNFSGEHGSSAMQGSAPQAARSAFWKAPIGTPGAVMVRRTVFEEVGGWNPVFNTTADRDLWCRIGAVAEFGFVNHVVVERRIHDANMSGDKNRARRQAVEVQLAFLKWCADHGVDTAFLQTSETEIFERNAKRAMEERAMDAAIWIADEATARGISSDVIARGKRVAGMPGLAREMELKVREFIGL